MSVQERNFCCAVQCSLKCLIVWHFQVFRKADYTKERKIQLLFLHFTQNFLQKCAKTMKYVTHEKKNSGNFLFLFYFSSMRVLLEVACLRASLSSFVFYYLFVSLFILYMNCVKTFETLARGIFCYRELH